MRYSFIDKLELIFTDVEVEGKKQGYARAATEYEKVFRSIQREYKETKELIESQINMYDKQSDTLIAKLEALEKQKKRLERQVRQKSEDVSEKYNIPMVQIQPALDVGTIFADPVLFSVFGMFFRYKERKLREAEQLGYMEARKLYEEKIDKLKKDLATLKRKGNSKIKEMINLINEVLDTIAAEQMKIAELKILLQGDGDE